MTEDSQLLRRYTEERAEPAFGELVTRHIDLVYSAALRVAGGDRHLAQDVAQRVFADLARKATSLPRGVVLAGWLYRHACFTAAKAVRAERRRKSREQTAMEMNALHDNIEPSWEQIAPVLDEAMNQLSARDRDAIVLRFLKQQDFRAVGSALGVGEDAAQKRVSRALEKLRMFLRRRGVTLTATVLGTTLATEAVVAAPTGLAISVTAASLAGATAAAGTGISATFMKLMAMPKVKAGVAGALVIASVVMPLMVQHKAQARLRDQDETLRQQAAQMTQLQGQRTRLSNLLAQAKNSRLPSNDQLGELMRLRGEVGRLRNDARELAQSATNASMSRKDMLAMMANYASEGVSQLKQLLEANPSESIPELRYLTEDDWRKQNHAPEANKDWPEEVRQASSRMSMSAVRNVAEYNLATRMLHPALQRYARDNNGQFPNEVSQLRPWFNSPIDDAVLQRWQILPATNLVRELQVLAGEDWVITQKAPVNEALDQRILVGLSNVRLSGTRITNRWVRVH
jgi:RNA polymerase sigma factor (sigma-70 family)